MTELPNTGKYKETMILTGLDHEQWEHAEKKDQAIIAVESLQINDALTSVVFFRTTAGVQHFFLTIPKFWGFIETKKTCNCPEKKKE